MMISTYHSSSSSERSAFARWCGVTTKWGNAEKKVCPTLDWDLLRWILFWAREFRFDNSQFSTRYTDTCQPGGSFARFRRPTVLHLALIAYLKCDSARKEDGATTKTFGRVVVPSYSLRDKEKKSAPRG